LDIFQGGVVFYLIDFDHFDFDIHVYQGRIGYLLEEGNEFLWSVIPDEAVETERAGLGVHKTHIADIIDTAKEFREKKTKAYDDRDDKLDSHPDGIIQKIWV